MTRWRMGLIGAAAALLATAAAGHAVAASPKGTLTYSWTGNVGPLDPHRYAPNQMFAQAMVYEPLVRYRDGGAIEPWLATAWTVSPDGRTYDFTLREGVTFSDGTPFDAAAVKANFDAVLADRARHDWLELVAQIRSVEALDARKLRLTLKDPYYPTLLELALIRPVRFAAPSVLTPDGVTKPVGTGPWMLTGTKKGEYDVFTRNPSYWGPKPAYERIVVKVIPDPTARAVAFETGEIDLIYGGTGQISADSFTRFKARGTGQTAVSAPLATRTMAINSGRAPTNDLAVRKAINHAVDKDAIVAKLLYGLEPKADTLFAANFPYSDLGLTPYAYDPARAARLLDEAGWILPPGGKLRVRDGQPLRVELCFIGNDARERTLAEAIQANLKAVGFDAQLVGEEENAIEARQKDGRFGLIFGDTWGAPYDPHSFVGSMRVPTHADYQAQRGLPMKTEIDATISAVLVTTDETTRRALYRDILTTLHEQAVYLPLSHLTAMAVSRGVEGVGFGASAYEIPFGAMRPAP
ncbi:nickel transport system substrate-binding protein [Azospirillum agricola]|uniref:nickel ABC transporter substrate-binding protein n=1 Tax=Azospirillum agricola TaxID=1720247 RepID=UPI001AE9253E|nr:nickel ABC transporter substrate-binding protein [Azospirillum agricola]MBP2228376.1 nickel transport system substrate-binding protein [Azospirillum agricola]